MPYITEELYQEKYAKNKQGQKESAKSLHLANWPVYDNNMKENMKSYFAENAGELAINIIGEVRKYKASHQMSLKAELSKVIVKTPLEFKKIKVKEVELKGWREDILNTTKAKELEIKPAKELKVEIKKA